MSGDAPIVSPAETVTVFTWPWRNCVSAPARLATPPVWILRLVPSGSVTSTGARRFEIAVEIVEGEDLHLNRGGGRDWHHWRLAGRAAGQRQQRDDDNLAEHQRARSAGSGCGSA